MLARVSAREREGTRRRNRSTVCECCAECRVQSRRAVRRVLRRWEESKVMQVVCSWVLVRAGCWACWAGCWAPCVYRVPGHYALRYALCGRQTRRRVQGVMQGPGSNPEAKGPIPVSGRLRSLKAPLALCEQT